MAFLCKGGRAVVRCCILVIAVVVSVGAYVYEPAGSRITAANFERLSSGMTEADVERILGCLQGDYTGYTAFNNRCGHGFEGLRRAIWVGREVTIVIEFAEIDGRLVDKISYTTLYLSRSSWFERGKQHVQTALGA